MLPLFVSAILVIVLDQASKSLIRSSLTHGQTIPVIKSMLYITRVHNKGAAFGLFSGKQGLFIAATILSIILIIVYYWKTHETNFVFNMALGLELGGAVGNLIDRVTFGGVTDFIHVPFCPVFNVADSAIVVGVGLLLMVSAKSMFKTREA